MKTILASSSRKGFTLLETAIMILMLSLVVAPLFNMLIVEKDTKTELKREAIDKSILAAIANFVRENGVYPCPALMNVIPTTATFGQENGRGAGPNFNNACGAGILTGALPVAALGLPASAAANAQGYKYIYVVTGNLTGLTTFRTSGGAGGITVRNNSGTNITTTAPFVIVDTGPDKRGGTALYGTTIATACTGPARAIENCNGNNIFSDANFAPLGNINNANYFDDTIVYNMTREESTLWGLTTFGNAATRGRLDMVSRNDGSLIIGAENSDDLPDNPAKLDVQGDVRILRTPTAAGNAGGNMDVDVRVQSNTFYYTP